MKQFLKIAVAILATVACFYSAQAQAQTQTANTAETNGEMLIRTSWRHFDDFAEDAVKYGIKLTTPDGFSAWESGNTNGSTSGHTSVVTEKYMRAMYHYHPIKGIENLFVTVENGEKVAIPHGTGEALPKEMQSDESVEVYYATLEKKVQEKQYFSRRECRRFNADEGFVANVPFDRPGYGNFKYNTCIVLKKGHVVLEVSLLTTPEGKAQEQKYLKALYKEIRFE